MQVILRTQADYPVHTELTLDVQTMAWGRGGPTLASINVGGASQEVWELRRWLGYDIRIMDDVGHLVWWGMVTEAHIAHGQLLIQYSLENMYNRVAVAYTDNGDRGTTDYAANARSVARYGEKEMLYSQSEILPDEAEQLRDNLLSQYAKPIPAARAGGRGGSLLQCRGYYSTLGWTKYANSTGRIVFEEGTKEVHTPLGWGMTSTRIGFAGNKIHDGDGNLGALSDGMKIVISNAANPGNNGEFTIDGSGQDGLISYTSSGISFSNSDHKIHDSNDGLANFGADAMLEVENSNENDGFHLTNQVFRDYLTIISTFGGELSHENDGVSVTLHQAPSALLAEEDIVQEAPGNSVTIKAHGERLAQSFTVPGVYDWTLGEVWIKAGKVGNPSDNLVVGIYTDSSGDPGTLVEAIVVTGDDLDDLTWIKFEADHTSTLTAGTTYHMRVSRSGNNDSANYYVVTVDEDTGDSGGALKVYDGSSWVTRWTDADMLYQVWGHIKTHDQMSRIVTAEGQFLTGISVRFDSGLWTRIYRDGDLSALDELEELFDTGTSGDEMIWPWVNAQKVLVVDTLADSSFPAAVLRTDGRLTDINGQPLRPGDVPVGRWVSVEGAPTEDDAVAPLSPVFLAGAEWNNGTLRFDFMGAPNPWEFGRTEQG